MPWQFVIVTAGSTGTIGTPGPVTPLAASTG